MIDFSMSSSGRLTILSKLKSMPLVLIGLIVAIACLGAMALTSAAAGDFYQWADKHLLRFAFLSVGMVLIALTHIKYWYWLSYPIWIIGFILLVIVEVMGHIGMGAQRWINLGVINLQPSELMKIAVIMALARYYHDLGAEKARKIKTLFWPVLIMGLPMALVMLQPDLGTALKIGMAGTVILFLAGVPARLFIAGIASLSVIIPLAYEYVLHDYQRKRIDIFLDPSQDPMGSGYHIIQSKIAIGSGGFSGKGFMQGTQSQLNFLPEKHTDFIFTLWTEEQGFIGGLLVWGLYLATFIFGFVYALQARHIFTRLLILGVTMNLSLYVMINTGMIMGLLPVVGVPLPMISHGGSVMMSALICYGLIISARLHRGQPLPKGEGI